MRSVIRDKEALMAVSPSAIAAYARASGWTKAEPFGDHSDVYARPGLPEIVLPRHQRLGDYASVVQRLIQVFAEVADTTQISLYRDLATADRDVVRVRAPDGDNGSVTLGDGAGLVEGAREMLLAAACSLGTPQPFYRAGANREATDFLSRVRLGQTEHGSFIITLLGPVVPPPIQRRLPLGPDEETEDDPIDRRITTRFVDALNAVRKATEDTLVGQADAFWKAVPLGVSANLCQGLVKTMEPFRLVDITLTWARTRPKPQVRDVVRFAESDVPVLRQAISSFSSGEPQRDAILVGFVRILSRDESELDGTVKLWTWVEGKNRSVSVVLGQSDYERALEAHKEHAAVVFRGDLERSGRRFRLLNPSVVDVIRDEPSPDESSAG